MNDLEYQVAAINAAHKVSNALSPLLIKYFRRRIGEVIAKDNGCLTNEYERVAIELATVTVCDLGLADVISFLTVDVSRNILDLNVNATVCKPDGNIGHHYHVNVPIGWVDDNGVLHSVYEQDLKPLNEYNVEQVKEILAKIKEYEQFIYESKSALWPFKLDN